jgi:hypothetical protein
MSEAVKVIRFYRTGGAEVLRIDEVRLPRLTEMETGYQPILLYAVASLR